MVTAASCRVDTPIYQLRSDGSVVPNPLFHRAWDKLHSRCVEYPFAATQVDGKGVILDVGTAKADPAWVTWLAGSSAVVHATDVDPPRFPASGIHFHRADVRALPLGDATVDLVLAVSVIEHIGLSVALVDGPRPAVSTDGHLEAFVELLRVVRPQGRIVLTFPFGRQAGLILGGSARAFNESSLDAYRRLAVPLRLDYYEYQHAGGGWCEEYPSPVRRVGRALRRLAGRTGGDASSAVDGAVTWRRVPRENAQALHRGHVDGVLCSLWRRR
jgi:SAM-dependent methyltransferase